MKLESLRDAFVHELRDLHSAETLFLKALPRMAKATTSEQLADALNDCVAYAREHVERLERILRKLGAPPRASTCKAMRGIIEESADVIKGHGKPDVIDALLITAAQRAGHYEMAGYGSARTFAEVLGETEAADWLQRALNDETSADKKLTNLATSGINEKAAMAQAPM